MAPKTDQVIQLLKTYRFTVDCSPYYISSTIINHNVAKRWLRCEVFFFFFIFKIFNIAIIFLLLRQRQLRECGASKPYVEATLLPPAKPPPIPSLELTIEKVTLRAPPHPSINLPDTKGSFLWLVFQKHWRKISAKFNLQPKMDDRHITANWNWTAETFWPRNYFSNVE